MQTTSINIPHTWNSGNIPAQKTTYTHDMRGRTIDSIHSVGAMTTQTRTTYDAAGRIATQTDEAGCTTTYTYADGGLTTTVTTPTGATLVTKRHTDGSLLEESGTGQQARYYSYHVTPQGLMTRVRLDTPGTDSLLSETVSDVLGKPLIIRIPGGDGTLMETRHSYDAKGRLVKTERSGQPTRLYEYDAMGNLIREIEKIATGINIDLSQDRIVSYAYKRCDGSTAGSILMGTMLDQNTSHMSGNERTRLKNSLTFTKTTKTWHHYGNSGQDVSETTLQLASATRHDLTQLKGRIDKNGYETLECTLVSGSVATRCHYTGSLYTAEYATTAEGSPVCETNRAGGRTTYLLSWQISGNTLQVTDPRGNTMTVFYDQAGRELSVTDATGTTLVTRQYSPVTGLLLKQTDAKGATVSYSYDVRGRKTAEYGTGTYPVRYQYDAANRLTGTETYRVPGTDLTTDPAGRTDGDSTTWTYDNATGLLKSKTCSDGSKESYTYDKQGRLLSETKASGRKKSFSYQFGRNTPQNITCTSSQTSGEIQYYHTCDHWNRICSAGAIDTRTDYECHYSYDYDDKGELSQENILSFDYGKSPCHLHHKRDEQGRYLGYDLSNNEEITLQSVTLEYDAQERICAIIHDENERFTYGYEEGTGLQNSLTYPNGIVKNIMLEEKRDYLSSITYAYPDGLEELYRQQVTYNADGSLGQDKRWMSGVRPLLQSYSYNQRGELIESQRTGEALKQWGYDNIGNRKQEKSGTEITSYITNKLNQYTAIARPQSAASAQTYDADGNQTKIDGPEGTWQVTYGENGRAQRYTLGNSKVSQTHDQAGRMIWEKIEGDADAAPREAIHIYLGNQIIAKGELLGEDRTPVILRTVLWDPTQPTATRPLLFKNKFYPLTSTDGNAGDQPILSTEIETEYGGAYILEEPIYYLHDHNKNVVGLMDQEGTLQAHYEYDPYGTVTLQTGGMHDINWLRYSSERFNPVTGLIDYLYRSYNPIDGRWPQRDPIAERGGVNLYNFVLNRPISFIDSLGLIAIMNCNRITYTKDGEWGYICQIYELNICKEIKCCEKESKELNSAKNYKSLQRSIENLNKCLLKKCSGRSVELNIHGPIYANFSVNPEDNSKSETKNDPYGRSGPLPPGAFRILPSPTGEGIDKPGSKWVTFHKGTPSPTDLNQTTPGYVTSPTGVLRKGLRIHGPFKSLGCLTCASGTSSKTGEGLIEQIMNRNKLCGGMYMEIEESRGIPTEHFENLARYMKGQHPDEGYYSPFPIESRTINWTF